jgi:hypothetical protein
MKSLMVGHRSLALAAATLLALLLAGQTAAASWQPKVRLTSSGFGQAGGLVTLGSSTAVAIYEGTESRIYVRRTTNSGASWAPRQKLNASAALAGGWPAIGGRGSKVDVVWNEVHDFFGDTGSLRYARSANGGASFGAALVLAPVSEGPIVARVARGPNGLVAVVWYESASNTIRARVSTNGGSSFGSARTLATIPQAWARMPVVAVGDGVVYAAYFIDETRIRVRRSLDGGASWKSATTVADNGSQHETIDALALTADGSLAYVGFTFENASGMGVRYRRSTDKGASWAAPADLASPSTSPRFRPRLSLRGGVVRAAFVRCTTPACGGAAVFYRQSTNGTSWSAAEKASHNATNWAWPAGVGFAGKVIVLYEAHNGGTSPYGPNVDVYVRAGSP